MSIDASHELELLAELAELGMVCVRKVAEAVEAAQDNTTLCALIDAHCSLGRCVRQCIALSLRIKSGTFPGERRAEPAETEPGDRPEREDRQERGEYWNEYERPDWETPKVHLTGDPAHDEAAIKDAVETAVGRIRKGYAKALAVLPPQDRPSIRDGLLTGTALRLVDTS